VYFFSIVLGFTNLVWLLKLELAQLAFPLRLTTILCLLILLKNYRKQLLEAARKKLKEISILVTVLLAGIVYTNKYSDLSPDFISSHSIMIASIQRGWNPIYDSNGNEFSKLNPWLSSSNFEFRAETGIASQVIQAFLNTVLNLDNSYFIVNSLFLILGSILLQKVVTTLCHLRGTKNSVIVLFKRIGVFLFLSPALVFQELLTGYNDLITYSMTTSIICLLLLYASKVKDYQKSLLPLFMLIVTLPSFKQNFILISIHSLFVLFLISLQNRSIKTIYHWVRSTYPVILLSFISLSVFPGLWTALRWINGTTPWHLRDRAFEQVWLSGQPGFYLNFNGLERMRVVLAGRTALNPESPDFSGLFSLPGRYEILDAGYLDNRMGGLGPLAGDAVLISIIIFLYLVPIFLLQSKTREIFKLNAISMTILYFTIGFVIFLLTVPMSFMIRYFPHYSLLIILLFFLIVNTQKELKVAKRRISATTHFLFVLVVLLVSLNSIITISAVIKLNAQNNVKISKLLSVVAESHDQQVFVAVGNKLGFAKRFGFDLLNPPTGVKAITCSAENIIYSFDDEISVCKLKS
jgi:hypothetical protein